MRIIFRSDIIPAVEAIAELYRKAKLEAVANEKIEKMYAAASLVVTAWHEDELVGIARSMTDFCSCCYMADVAVNDFYKCAGIARRLIEETRNIVGKDADMILLSTPRYMQYYSRIGMEKIGNGFILQANSII